VNTAPEESVMPAAFDRLLLALSDLRSYGIETRISNGEDAETEMDLIQEQLRQRFPDATGCCLVVLRSDLDCFSPDGRLTKTLLVHQRGLSVLPAARAALGKFGLEVSGNADSRMLVFDAMPEDTGLGFDSPLAGLEQ
jgi:hypothetical protein